MAFRALFGLLVSLFFSTTSWAEEIKLNPSHPNQYSVAEGDTLWGISAKFLKDPWLWPQIWKNNPGIDNPNMIYPGNVITLSFVDGKPQLQLATVSNDNHRVLSPKIREYDIKEAITLIPIDAIAPFLSSPKIVSKHQLSSSPYVVDFAGEHLIAGAGDRVYVRSIINPKGLGFTIFRQGETFRHLRTGEILGYEAIFIADATLQRKGDPATLLITRSEQEIRKGDRLIPNEEGQLSLHYFPRPPEIRIRGSILSVLSGVTQIGQHNIVVIDKGTSDGLQTGHVLQIYQRGLNVDDSNSYDKLISSKIRLPDEDAGTLMVFRTFARLSYALVIEATGAIHVFDYVETP